jgi:dTDP-4-amino-4,6-dideoxy-D-galactose acyltransferase
MIDLDRAECETLGWDSEFWGVKIASVVGDHLTPERVCSIEAWCTHNNVDCIYFLANVSDFTTTALATRSGFNLVDIRMTYSRSQADEVLTTDHSTVPVLRTREVAEDDVPTLERIARESYRDSRFYHDPKFPDAQCDTLYSTWIRRSCHGYAEAVLVAAAENSIAGFISCHLPAGSQTGSIGLVGVDSTARGGGIGKLLVASALRWFAHSGAARVDVVTQGRNLSAQRLYQRCGFVTSDVRLWFHKWYA